MNLHGQHELRFFCLTCRPGEGGIYRLAGRGSITVVMDRQGRVTAGNQMQVGKSNRTHWWGELLSASRSESDYLNKQFAYGPFARGFRLFVGGRACESEGL